MLQYTVLVFIFLAYFTLYNGILKDGNDNPICKTEKETQMYRTDFWTLWEKARVGCLERTASKHVYYVYYYFIFIYYIIFIIIKYKYII